MAINFKKAMALTLAAAMVVTAAPATNFGAISVDAASYKVTGTKVPYTKTTNKYVIKGLKKGMYAKVSITGTAKSKVTVKKGKTVVKAATKIKGTGKNITLKVTNKAAAGKKYNVVVKYFNKKGKKVATKKVAATIYNKTTAVTITPVTTETATGAAIAATGATIQVGQTVTLKAATTPAKNTRKITWSTKDAKVASVVNGLVTGVGAGTTQILATSGAKSATYEVTVDASNVAAKIVAAGSKQTAAHKIDLAFDSDASKKVTRDDITVARKDGTETISIDELNFTADGKTATIVLSKALTDKVTYVVSQKADSATFEFEASVGEPASFLFKTVTAPKGEEVKIDYEVLDAKGIDVTKAISNINTVIRAEMKSGSQYNDYNFDKANNLKIKMGNVGDKATVVLKYEKDTNKFEGEGVIECVKNTGKVGTGIFAQVKAPNDVNFNSKAAKFYSMTTTASAAYIEVGSSTGDGNKYKNIYFCALDAKGQEAINYDSYEVTSGDERILAASAERTSGRFTIIRVDGNKEGNTNITVKAIVNDAATTYTIPVVVRKEAVIDQVTVTPSKKSISNTYDDLYYTTVDVKVYDQYKNEITADSEITQKYDDTKINKNGVGAAYLDDTAKAKLTNVKDALGFTDANYKSETKSVKYTAYGAKGGTYNVEVSASYGGKTVTRSTSISVTALSEELWTKGQSVKYEVELKDGRSELDAGTTDKDKETAYLVAKVGSTFVGYVRQYLNGEVVIGSPYTYVQGTVNTSVAITTDMAFTARTASAIYNDKTITLVSASATKNKATVASGVVFTAKNYTAGKALEGLKIEVCSGGVTIANGTTVSSATIAPNNDDWIVRSGKTIYVNVAGVNTMSALVTQLSGAGFAAGKYAETGAGVGAIPSTYSVIVTTTAAASANTGIFDTYKDGMKIVDDNNGFKFYFDPTAHAGEIADRFNEIATAGSAYANARCFTAAVSGTATNVITEAAMKTAGGNDGISGRVAAVTPTDATKLSAIKAGVKYGTYYSKGALYSFGSYKSKNPYSVDGVVAVNLTTRSDNAKKFYVSGTRGYDRDFADAGSYTVRFEYTKNGSSDSATKNITVKNSMYIPKVYTSELALEDINATTVIDSLKASVDQCNEEALNKSIKGIYIDNPDKDKTPGATPKDAVTDKAGKNIFVKYVLVEEGDIEIYVPIGTNFSVAS